MLCSKVNRSGQVQSAICCLLLFIFLPGSAGAWQEGSEADGSADMNTVQLPEVDAPVSSLPPLLLTGYCVAVMLASLAGGCLPAALRMSHTTSQTVASLAGGLMLGIAVFHLLPHSLHSGISANWAMQCVMAGIVTMFLLIRCFHFHHHGPLEISTAEEEPCSDHCDHHSDSEGDVSHSRVADESPHCHHAHELSWLGIMAGLSLHSLLDGIALAASVNSESRHSVFLSLAGFGTFLAVLVHKPLDAISITSLMVFARWERSAILRANLLFSLLCPVGVMLFSAGVSQVGTFQQVLVPSALAFSSGVFLCIALSDLLPEMEFHSHNRLLLTTALLSGILIAYGITFLESAGLHYG